MASSIDIPRSKDLLGIRESFFWSVHKDVKIYQNSSSSPWNSPTLLILIQAQSTNIYTKYLERKCLKSHIVHSEFMPSSEVLSLCKGAAKFKTVLVVFNSEKNEPQVFNSLSSPASYPRTQQWARTYTVSRQIWRYLP